MKTGKYAIKTDDLLLRLLNDYHQIDASEVFSFFGERVKEMLKCEPNITEKSRRNVIQYHSNTERTVSVHKKSSSNKNFLKENRVYVLRGFYPNTNLPFKMTLVKFDGYEQARAKVIIGLKEHHTTIYESQINSYQEAVSEAILLSEKVDPEAKVKYIYRKFKAMRPRGVELYSERDKTSSD